MFWGGESKNDRAGFVRCCSAAGTQSKSVGARDGMLDLLQNAALLLKGNTYTRTHISVYIMCVYVYNEEV